MTLPELLTVLVVVFILCALGLSGLTSHSPRLANPKANMHSFQIYAESYGKDNGTYSSTSQGLRPYGVGGGNKIGGASGNFPTNPYTGVTNELAVLGLLNTRAKVLAARARTDSSNIGGGTKGQTTYVGIADPANPAVNTSYAITGVDEKGNDVTGNLGKMVLSNQW